MGYCYESRTGKLCCDICDNAGGVRKMRCPVGWCQPIACCQRPECKEKLKTYRKDVCSCKCVASSEKFAREKEAERQLLEAGRWVRCAAVGIGDNAVRVWFKNKDGQQVEKLMSHAAYDSYPLCTPTTIEDYQAVGDVLDCEPAAAS